MNLRSLPLVFILIGILFPSIVIAHERQIYLVRHAEKQSDGTRDPSLTKKGNLRASNIAEMLKDKEISTIYSSPYKRTNETASPLASLLNLQVKLYDPSDLKTFAEKIKMSSGNILIVGHSNTTPQLFSLLGGESFGEIKEMEYDRVYLLDIDGQKVKSSLLYSSADKK